MEKIAPSWFVCNGRYISDLSAADLARKHQAERAARETARRERYEARQRAEEAA